VARRLRGAVGLPDRSGILVRAVEDDSPAAKAGIERGDLLVGAGGQPLEEIDDLYALLDAPDTDSIELTVLHGSDERTVTVELGSEQ
jgi:serine protease Do